MIFGFRKARITSKQRTAIIGIARRQGEFHWVRRRFSRSRTAGHMMAVFLFPRRPIPTLILPVRLLITKAVGSCYSSYLIFDLPDRKESGGIMLTSDSANHALQRTRPSRSGCNRGASRSGPLSLGR